MPPKVDQPDQKSHPAGDELSHDHNDAKPLRAASLLHVAPDPDGDQSRQRHEDEDKKKEKDLGHRHRHQAVTWSDQALSKVIEEVPFGAVTP